MLLKLPFWLFCILKLITLFVLIYEYLNLLAYYKCAEDPAKKPTSIVDVGCGIGGSSRYLAKKYGATAKGITLSPVQAERAQALAAAQGLGDKVYAFELEFVLHAISKLHPVVQSFDNWSFSIMSPQQNLINPISYS